MSVYTSITQSDLETLLLDYSIGELVDFQGITAGIENTNYFVTTTAGKYVLTIFEHLRKEELPFYVELMAFLNEHAVPSAHPIADNTNCYLQTLLGKPAILMQRLQGASVDKPEVQHCKAIGLALANFHLKSLTFGMQQTNTRGQPWRIRTGRELLKLIADDEAKVLAEELQAQQSQHYEELPQGVIHADLFRDNVLFDGDQLSGILDLYNACNDSLLYDVAITVNDWCVQQNGSLDFLRAIALCHAYSSLRPVTDREKKAWPMMLRSAALRFWLSRLWDRHHPKPGEMTFQKDPGEFLQILLARIDEATQLNEVWR